MDAKICLESGLVVASRSELLKYDDGTVTDESGYVLGNIYNEI